MKWGHALTGKPWSPWSPGFRDCPSSRRTCMQSEEPESSRIGSDQIPRTSMSHYLQSIAEELYTRCRGLVAVLVFMQFRASSRLGCSRHPDTRCKFPNHQHLRGPTHIVLIMFCIVLLCLAFQIRSSWTSIILIAAPQFFPSGHGHTHLRCTHP